MNESESRETQVLQATVIATIEHPFTLNRFNFLQIPINSPPPPDSTTHLCTKSNQQRSINIRTSVPLRYTRAHPAIRQPSYTTW